MDFGLSGTVWLTISTRARAENPRTYAVFIKDGKVIDGRYAVQIDACNTQTYNAFDPRGPMKAMKPGVLGPLY